MKRYMTKRKTSIYPVIFWTQVLLLFLSLHLKQAQVSSSYQNELQIKTTFPLWKKKKIIDLFVQSKFCNISVKQMYIQTVMLVSFCFKNWP